MFIIKTKIRINKLKIAQVYFYEHEIDVSRIIIIKATSCMILNNILSDWFANQLYFKARFYRELFKLTLTN